MFSSLGVDNQWVVLGPHESPLPRQYRHRWSDLRQVLLSIPDSVQRVLLVGHNPGFESLLRYLAPNIQTPGDGKLMPTATLAYLQLGQQWSFLQGRCLLQRPKDLAE